MDTKTVQLIHELRRELHELDRKRSQLQSRINALAASQQDIPHSFAGSPAAVSTPQSPREKIDLFLSLFRCRADVYPHYWENRKSGKQGYSPVCENEWKKNICFKPKVSCSKCSNQAFKPLDAYAVHDHLTGKSAIGSYAIDAHDASVFLAADFDKSTWKSDVLAYKRAALEFDIQVSIEISKSGNGAHAWIFFTSPIAARKVRKLGDSIMSRAMERDATLSLDSYDRFFPNQDLLPAGGFGNLIALPLQHAYRKDGHTLFVTDDFIPIEDQWEYLASIHRLDPNDIDTIIHEYLGESFASLEHDELQSAQVLLRQHMEPAESYDGTVVITTSSQLAIPLDQIPGTVVSRLKKMATIANPKFFEAQRMRFSTWNIPRYIFCGNNDETHIYLPRSLSDTVIEYLSESGFKVIAHDARNSNEKLELTFSGSLQDHQEAAVDEMLKHDLGLLVAPTGTGKTEKNLVPSYLTKIHTLCRKQRNNSFQYGRLHSKSNHEAGVQHIHISHRVGAESRLNGFRFVLRRRLPCNRLASQSSKLVFSEPVGKFGICG